MQAGGPDNATVSEAPSSGSKYSECKSPPEPVTDAYITDKWDRELLVSTGVVDPNEVSFALREYFYKVLSNRYSTRGWYDTHKKKSSNYAIVSTRCFLLSIALAFCWNSK